MPGTNVNGFKLIVVDQAVLYKSESGFKGEEEKKK